MKTTFARIGMLGLAGLMVSGLFSCEKEEPTGRVLEQSITPMQEDYAANIPFADSAELKSMRQGNVADYELVRKIAYLEMDETGMLESMGWSGCRLSELPVAIYDLNSRPRYYDFIVYNAERRPLGTVRTYAKRERSTTIEGTYGRVLDYNAVLTKSSSASPSLFMDWKGERFAGVKSKFGEGPSEVVNSAGEAVASSQVRDLEGMEIVDHMSEFLGQLAPSAQQLEEILAKAPEHLRNDPRFREEMERSQGADGSATRDSLVQALDQTQSEAEAFWREMAQHEQELMGASDAEITSGTKFFGRIYRRIFNSPRRKPYALPWYESEKKNYRCDDIYWCGPWVCGYIVYVNQKRDKYNFFRDCAATVGELKVGNFALRLLGRPMTPVEMSWSMPIASKGKIWISPVPIFSDMAAYDQIYKKKRPAIRLCCHGGELHWTLAYGTFCTGNVWRNYYFLQVDNGSKIKVKDRGWDPGKPHAYHRVEWWNPWLMVWD